MSNLRSQLLDIALNDKLPGVDSILLGGDELPGQWLLQSTKREYIWQTQQGWGLNGAWVKPVGLKNVECSFLARFWTAQAWAAFQPLRRKYFARQTVALIGNAEYAMGILHPELNAIGVMSVVLKSTPVFTNDGRGLWTAVVEFLEFRGKPQPIPESPDATLPAAHAPTPSAADNADSEGALHDNEINGSRG